MILIRRQQAILIFLVPRFGVVWTHSFAIGSKYHCAVVISFTFCGMDLIEEEETAQFLPIIILSFLWYSFSDNWEESQHLEN